MGFVSCVFVQNWLAHRIFALQFLWLRIPGTTSNNVISRGPFPPSANGHHWQLNFVDRCSRALLYLGFCAMKDMNSVAHLIEVFITTVLALEKSRCMHPSPPLALRLSSQANEWKVLSVLPFMCSAHYLLNLSATIVIE